MFSKFGIFRVLVSWRMRMKRRGSSLYASGLPLIVNDSSFGNQQDKASMSLHALRRLLERERYLIVSTGSSGPPGKGIVPIRLEVKTIRCKLNQMIMIMIRA